MNTNHIDYFKRIGDYIIKADGDLTTVEIEQASQYLIVLDNYQLEKLHNTFGEILEQIAHPPIVKTLLFDLFILGMFKDGVALDHTDINIRLNTNYNISVSDEIILDTLTEFIHLGLIVKNDSDDGDMVDYVITKRGLDLIASRIGGIITNE